MNSKVKEKCFHVYLEQTLANNWQEKLFFFCYEGWRETFI